MQDKKPADKCGKDDDPDAFVGPFRQSHETAFLEEKKHGARDVRQQDQACTQRRQPEQGVQGKATFGGEDAMEKESRPEHSNP